VFIVLEQGLKNEVKWSGGRSTPVENRGKAETPQRSRETTEKLIAIDDWS